MSRVGQVRNLLLFSYSIHRTYGHFQQGLRWLGLATYGSSQIHAWGMRLAAARGWESLWASCLLAALPRPHARVHLGARGLGGGVLSMWSTWLGRRMMRWFDNKKVSSCTLCHLCMRGKAPSAALALALAHAECVQACVRPCVHVCMRGVRACVPGVRACVALVRACAHACVRARPLCMRKCMDERACVKAV